MRALAIMLVILGSLFALLNTSAPPAPRRGTEPLPKGAIRQFGTEELRDGYVDDLDLSPDGKVLALAGSQLRLWNLDERKELPRLLHPESPSVNHVRFSPDDQYLACLYFDRQLVIWDWAKGHQVLMLPDNQGPFVSFAFSHDGKRLATGTDKGKKKSSRKAANCVILP